MTVQGHYNAVLRDLIEKKRPLHERLDELARLRDSVVVQLEELDVLISGMNKFAVVEQDYVLPTQNELTLLGVYSHMSMRWASLKLLFGRKGEFLTTAAIASALLEGGYPSSPNFNSKLSAILGQMVSKNEVERGSDGWRITETGLNRWAAIRESERYTNRGATISEDDSDGEAA